MKSSALLLVSFGVLMVQTPIVVIEPLLPHSSRWKAWSVENGVSAG